MVPVMRSPRESIAFKLLAKCRVDGVEFPAAGSVWANVGPRIPLNDFCKRCVPVASCSVVLRTVASVYPSTPKNVLCGAFQKTRRAARTIRSERMSERLATLQGSPAFRRSVKASKFRFVASAFHCVA